MPTYLILFDDHSWYAAFTLEEVQSLAENKTAKVIKVISGWQEINIEEV